MNSTSKPTISKMNEIVIKDQFEQLLLGDFPRYGVRPNFDNLDQAVRYNVLSGDNIFQANDWTKEICKFRQKYWALPEGNFIWEPSDLPRLPSGIVYITSGRAEWFAREGVSSPIFLWCLIRGLPIDVVTDVCEAEHYRRALRDTDNIRALERALGMFAEVSGQPPTSGLEWQQRLGDIIQVVAPVSKGNNNLQTFPRGFGFNRYVSLEWMRRRFAGLCAIVDDNTASLGPGTLATLDWLFTPGNINRRVASCQKKPPEGSSWLCLSFRPCNVAVNERREISELREKHVAVPSISYDGSSLRTNSIDSPWIIQQFTVWNAATYASLGSGFPPNYDHTLLTGKEDVDLFRRLTGAVETRGLVLCDETVQIAKCSADTRPNPNKEAALVARIAEQVRHFCPAFGRILAEDNGDALAALASRFRDSGKVEEREIRTPDARRSLVREVLRKQNMILEQILVPGL